MEVEVTPGAPYPNMDPSAAPPAGPRGPTSRLEYGAGSAAPEKITIVLDSPHDRHISHARAGAGSKVSPHRLTSLVPSQRVKSRYFYTRNNYFVLHAGMQTLYGSDSPRPPLQKSVGERLPIRHWAPMLSTGNYFPYGGSTF